VAAVEVPTAWLAGVHTGLVGPTSAPLPPLTVASGLTTWTLDPVALAVVLVAGAVYVAGLRQMRGRQAWSLWRTVSFTGGLLTIVAVTLAGVGAYSHTLFATYAVQVISLLAVAPTLLALGAPISLVRAAWPARTTGLDRVLRTLPLRLLTWPVVGSFVVALGPLLFYLTPWFEASLRHYAVYELTHLVLLGVGFAYFWPLAGVDPVAWRMPAAVLAVIVLAETLFDAIPGLVIWLSTRLLAPAYYLGLHRDWGRSPLADQKLGGALLWGVGESVGLPFMAIVIAHWLRQDAAEAAAVDAAEDARAAATRPLGPTGDDGPEALLQRPWWETDPRFTDRYGPRRPSP